MIVFLETPTEIFCPVCSLWHRTMVLCWSEVRQFGLLAQTTDDRPQPQKILTIYLYSVTSLIHTFFSVLGMSGQRWVTQQPLLAMAIRGPYARALWQEIAGPSDPMLARRTDPASINALHCHSRERTLFHSPCLASLVHLGLCVWFGGRLPNNDHRMTAK